MFISKKVRRIFLITLIFFPAITFSQSKYKVIAYYTGSAENIKQYPLDKLTHVIYSFLKFQSDTLAFRDSMQMQNVH
ncbi:MAG: hypothetical protein WDM90_14005 [Ferruginibacter sp.]